MRENETALDRKVRERRHKDAIKTIATRYSALNRSDTELEFLELDEVGALWETFLQRYEEHEPGAATWPLDHRSEASDHLHRIMAKYHSSRIVWLPQVRSEHVAVELPMTVLIDLPLGALVSEADDLRLSSRDGLDGLLLELTHPPGIYTFELVSWGAFDEGR